MTAWRYLRYRPGKAHLWALAPSGVWRSRCTQMCVIDLPATTWRLEDEPILKCKKCMSFERRYQEFT